MPDLIGRLNRGYHRLVDLYLRVDPSSALNRDRQPRPGGPGIAQELFAAVQAMKAEAYDPSCNCFDYKRLADSDTYALFRSCTARLLEFDPSVLDSRQQRLAFWINLYNALIIDAVIAFQPQGSVRKDRGFFRRAAYIVGGRRYSADDIEHGILRGNRRHFYPAILLPQFATDDPRLPLSVQPLDPRIHCALVCASRSCPPIAAYQPERIDEQLDLACSAYVNDGMQMEEKGRLCLSPVFRWYQRDYGGREGVREFVLRYLDDGQARTLLEDDREGRRLGFYRYDWSLNQI
ncbi:MAG: DUF547 domain-containing protein [Dehalococcoidia bacterium]